ncbi:DUF2934 domain-containing protein [Nitrosomonas sp. Nm166]|uniref:DUF2934 domain-containing protein n=1 Tax=Nitrosomonas sp. Nm166 TaxID=1881054 RepID=UPI0008EAD501|nr:DUF2934 domain-containing protein [Nitrosomonas sp. Nm166]SFF09574.1 Protein of unknown function [Nitrosomonas sp. Nm166]
MPSKVNEVGIKKSGTRLSKSQKNILANQAVNQENAIDRREMIANAAYYRAEKRGFQGNEADAVQDWLEAEMEIDNELETFDVDERDFQFPPNKIE